MLVNGTPETFRPGSFDWTLDRLSLPGDPKFTAIAKVACREWSAWPEELLGREAAGEAVSDPENLPLTFQSVKPSQLGHVVLTRRVAWHLAGRMTNASAVEIGATFGRRSAASVQPFMRNPHIFDRLYPEPRVPMSETVERLATVAMFVSEMEHL